jgi:hypothetical protein
MGRENAHFAKFRRDLATPVLKPELPNGSAAYRRTNLLCYSSFISDMSQPSSSFSFQALFNTALQDYESQTGTRLIDHPLAKKLE